MIWLFDYLLYFIYTTYKRFGEKDIPLFYSITILSLFQGFNIISIIELIDLYVYDLSFLLINKWYLIVAVVISIINAFIYSYKNRSKLVLEKYKNPKYNSHKYLIVTYVILSIITIIIVANLKRASL
jgi:accessory gene regulator protein AgrB